MVNETAFQAWSGHFGKQADLERTDLTGRTVLVVGASTGIGLETARHFATMSPARLILACRSEARGTKAIQSIKETTGYQAELWLVELSDFSSVKAFADRLDNELDDLDILVANAAIGIFNWVTTEDGWETSLQVNYLSLALICLRALPKMLKTAEKRERAPRIVFVSSGVHQDAKIPDSWLDAPSVLDAINGNTSADGMTRYPLSKYLDLLFVIALAERLPAKKPTVIINSVNPGLCVSELRREVTGAFYVVSKIMEWICGRTSEVGSRQLLWCALARPWDEEKLQGAYVSDVRTLEPGDNVISEKGKKFRELLWHDTIKNLSKVDGKIQPIATQYL
ncbi:hypothetical protein HGRIS_005115 [Hohenbuehelia grisea]|uniref:Uncharacterized protein n=1 Tax=Hohenbuehelia grisea TaxID=104357 RepID=A0ABR3JE27_9AGAR